MEFTIHSHRFGAQLLNDVYPELQSEIFHVVRSITDEDIIRHHEEFNSTQKSISKTLNSLLKAGFTGSGWQPESPIFQDPEYAGKQEKIWRLDFAKGPVSMEVAYNHGEALAWNLLKPILASELNHVSKAIQTEIGVLILATQGMKDVGGFDSAVGTFEKAVRYLLPLQSQLTVPLVLIGLNPPKTFVIDVRVVEGKKRGFIVKH